MTQERSERLAAYFTSDPEPCERYGRQAKCRSVTAQRDAYSDTYTLEEIVFSEPEGDITRYDLTQAINFGGIEMTASIEQGKLIEVTNPIGKNFGDVETPSQERVVFAKNMFHAFARIMRENTTDSGNS